MIRADGQGLARQDGESLAGRRAVEENLLPVQAPAEERVPAKQVIRHFFNCLEELSISYCHWKSNIRLGATLAGREDIDLLVDPRCDAQIHAALARCGFRTAVSRAGTGHPGIFHALALDSATGELVDLHAYHQIVSGDSRSEEHTSELQSLMRTSYAVFCLKKKKTHNTVPIVH